MDKLKEKKKLTRSVNDQHVESYVWDNYMPAPFNELNRMTKPCMRIIKEQPFFTGEKFK